MLKKILTTTALAVGIIALPSAASAEDGWQWRVFGGGSMPNDQDLEATLNVDTDVPATGVYDLVATTDIDMSYDTGWVVGGAFGATRGSWTIEGELAYRSIDAELSSPGFPGYTSDEFDVSATSFLVNAWYNFSLDAPIGVYLGGGAGLASIDIDDDISDFGAAWQVGGGVRFGGDGPIGYGIGYRYVALPAVDDQILFGNVARLDINLDETNTHELIFELTF